MIPKGKGNPFMDALSKSKSKPKDEYEKSSMGRDEDEETKEHDEHRRSAMEDLMIAIADKDVDKALAAYDDLCEVGMDHEEPLPELDREEEE